MSGVVMMSTYIFTAECSDQVFLVSRVVADCDWETTSPEKTDSLGGGADIGPVGRSLGHAQVSWAETNMLEEVWLHIPFKTIKICFYII